MGKGLFIERMLSLEELQRDAHPEDAKAIAHFGSMQRRTEYLMWRRIVRRELGDDTLIEYSATGAPKLTNRSYHIGVSHCKGYAAVCISDKPCAVDIEQTSRNFARIAPKFASINETKLSNDPLLLPALWCAKETLYKYSGSEELDLIDDLVIEKIDFAANRIIGRIKQGESINISTLEWDGVFAAYIL